MKIQDIKIYEITPEALDYYRNNVKGNYRTPEAVVIMKLSRNIMLAEKEKRLLETIYTYGNLRIVTKRDKIVEIDNHPRNMKPTWRIDVAEKKRINKVLGIREDRYKKKFTKVN